uniref:Uncharacterized protein n=1 Tax=Anguilla anguilla TaxID=7936 RepID=A0A0E9RRJ4_ANGAN
MCGLHCATHYVRSLFNFFLTKISIYFLWQAKSAEIKVVLHATHFGVFSTQKNMTRIRIR